MSKFTVISGNPQTKTELPFIIRFDNPSSPEEAEAWEREEIGLRRRASNRKRRKSSVHALAL